MLFLDALDDAAERGVECLALLNQIVLVLFSLGHATRLQPLQTDLYQVLS